MCRNHIECIYSEDYFGILLVCTGGKNSVIMLMLLKALQPGFSTQQLKIDS